MKDDPGNVVRFRPRPKAPPPKPKSKPKQKAQPYRPAGGQGEPAINWSRTPKAAVIIVLFLAAMWLLSGLAGWIGRLGTG